MEPTNYKGPHGAIYNNLVRSEQPLFRQYISDRLGERGIDWNDVRENISRVPNSVPQSHRIAMLRYLLNGFPTTVRLRFLPDVVVLPCPFCGACNQDTKQHWTACPTLCSSMLVMYGDGEAQRTWNSAMLTLQAPMGGDDLHRVCACVHAVWRCRCVRVRGYNHAGIDDLASHLRLLIEDPWLRGDLRQNSSRDRRASRIVPPKTLPNIYVYNADGASRTRMESARIGSMGALLRFNGITLARYAVYLGDVSNNIAEYHGVIESLERANRVARGLFCFRLDSMLVVKQLSGEWACRAEHLIPLYERALALLGSLRAAPDVEGVQIQHVYREFNAEADSLANEGLDAYNPRIHNG